MNWLKLAIGALVALAVVALVYHYRAELAHRIVLAEQWIARLGFWGPLVFTGLFIVLTSFFVPDSLLSAAAGALFGVAVGTVSVVLGATVAQSIAFGISRYCLQDRVRQALASRPKFAAIQRAADREGLRLLLLLRLTPLNPVVVSYVIATTRIRFLPFVLATACLAPAMFVQVYFGYAAKHLVKVAGGVSQHSAAHTVLTVVGLLACVAVFVYVTRVAQRAIAQAEREEK